MSCVPSIVYGVVGVPRDGPPFIAAASSMQLNGDWLRGRGGGTLTWCHPQLSELLFRSNCKGWGGGDHRRVMLEPPACRQGFMVWSVVC